MTVVTITGARSQTMHKQAQALLKRAKSVSTLPYEHALRKTYVESVSHHIDMLFGALKNTSVDSKVHVTKVVVPPAIRTILRSLNDIIIDQDHMAGPAVQFDDKGCLINVTDINCLQKHLEKQNNHMDSMTREERIKRQLKLFGGIYNADDQEYYETVMKPVLNATKDAEAARRKAQSTKDKTSASKLKRIAKITKPAKLKRIDDGDLTKRQLRKKYNGRWMRVRYDALVLLGTRCMCCGIKAGDANEMGESTVATGDHVMPFMRNPDLRVEPLNIQILCNFCNESKGHTDLTDWRTPAHIRKQMVARLGFAPDNDRDMMVLLEYVGYKHTQRESAKRLGIGQATVSRTYNKFKELLREEDRR